MAQTIYGIRRWDEIFENSQSRQHRRLSWVPVPNKHDGKSYRRLIARENGPALYGAWCLMVQVASKCPVRGVLADEDGPLDAEDLAAKTGVPAKLFAEAFELLSQPKIGWLSVVPPTAEQQHANSFEPNSASERNGTELNGKEQTPVPVAEAFAKPRKTEARKPKRPSIFGKLTVDFLRNDMTLADWFKAATQRDDPIITSSEINLLNVFGAREHALKPGRAKKSPVALFADTVRNQRWDDITNAEEDRARKCLTLEVKVMAGVIPPLNSEASQ